MGCDSEFTRADFDCPCCAGQTEFNWFDDTYTCDECAISILRGRWTAKAHGHELSREQVACLAEDAHTERGAQNGSH